MPKVALDFPYEPWGILNAKSGLSFGTGIRERLELSMQFATFCGKTSQNRALDHCRHWGLGTKYHHPIKGFPSKPSTVFGVNREPSNPNITPSRREAPFFNTFFGQLQIWKP